jgi:uncharacterized integral membrane protein
MIISLMLAVVITILAAYFASNNLTAININLLGYAVRGTTGVMMVSALGIGVLLGIAFMLPALISRSWALMRHKRKLQDLQGTLNSKYTPEEAHEE